MKVIATHITPMTVIATHVTPITVISTHVTPITVITTHVTPIAVIATHITPITVRATHVTPITVITTHITPITVIATHVTPIAVVSCDKSFTATQASLLVTTEVADSTERITATRCKQKQTLSQYISHLWPLSRQSECKISHSIISKLNTKYMNSNIVQKEGRKCFI